MKHLISLLLSLLFIIVLSSCDQVRILSLPELEALYEDLSACVPEIDSISASYGNSSDITIYVRFGERYQNIDDRDALTVVKKVRALFMQKEFQKAFLPVVRGVKREEILSYRYDAPTVTLFIYDFYRPAEKGTYNYFLEAHFFFDEDLSDGGKGHTYDGYSTWRGYRYDTDYGERELFVVNDLDGELQFDFIISN